MNEQAIKRREHFSRLATRYEKPVVTFLAMITIAWILEWQWNCNYAPAGPVSPDPR